MSNNYWDLFEQTGSIGAYLAYRTLNGMQEENDENAFPYNAREFLNENVCEDDLI